MTTTAPDYVTNKLFNWSKCESFKILLKARYVSIATDAYLNNLSRGGLFVSSKSLLELPYSTFAILDFVKPDDLSDLHLLKHWQNILCVITIVCNFTCNEHLAWSFNFAA